MPYVIDGAQIFSLFFLMLGPLKVFVPYARMTRMLDDYQARTLAFQASAIAAVSVIIGPFVGRAILDKWSLPPKVLMLALGIVFFIVAMQNVIRQFSPEAPSSVEKADPPNAMNIVFPTIVTPYGMAAMIVLLSTSQSADRTILIVALALVNIVLDLLVMVYARSILKYPAIQALFYALLAILGMLIAALGLHIILVALHQLGIIPNFRPEQ